MPVQIKKYLSGFSALIFPSLCKGCGTSLGTPQKALCRACESSLPRTYFEKVPKNPVEQVFWGRTRLELATSIFFYRKGELLQSLIHQLKYRGIKSNGTYLGSIAGKVLVKESLQQKFDLLLPVPLHYRKQKKRGYNQSEIICEGINSVTHIPIDKTSVIRTVHSDSQTRRSRYERWENVEGIFRVIHPEHLENKHILLVDDVVTTGSTIEALYIALKKVQNVKVSVLSIGLASG
ncbi:ComF family protein [Marinilabilia rubra]|uniref:Amidophosphoribosyltransferase n=1 Tax=Marinilabilia rubra TaxID=2162893 RepID=A0A2U2B8W4_9BACT|nr:ComF family protein [Marinilabilia rubra]PWD99508.1 amidophosphoribosyltransferase [Marinilabilia rubra]